ncbi:MAG: TerB family tellurite resistance protein [Flavobacteriales bacterium]|nr:TerB family tellurite resistance protein [Flavobacteriales bacterium]MBK7554368.1 TerB family tellurite resistance protein [Flavobacteriales bacterium]MBP6575382.1 TerB family tellurite resistance protein [Flavobacteriales bacterium]
MSYGKWIVGGLGFAVGGPIGALVGFTLGSLLDRSAEAGAASAGPKTEHRSRSEGQHRQQAQAGSGDFAMSLVVLTAAVMKADGKATQRELEFVRRFFLQQFGEAKAKDLLVVLRDVLERDIPVGQVCEQIRQNVPHPARLQLVHYLIGIAAADGSVHASEREMVRRIANYLGISERDLDSMSAMFRKPSASSAYEILEIERTVTDEEVKKAYRRMAMKHHPDRVAQMGEAVQKAAAEKFKKVQEAYERIQGERGMK